MPARKGAKKSAGKKVSSKKSSKGSSKSRAGLIPMYAVPIGLAAARGDAGEMRSVASAARKHLNDVQKALAQLEKKLARG